MESIQNSNSTPVRLSEQQGVDCSGSYGNGGCNGGHMYYYWRFSHYEGSMLSSDYPYTARDESCKQTSSSTIAARANINTVFGLGDQAPVASIYAALASGPLNIAVNASGSLWQNY